MDPAVYLIKSALASTALDDAIDHAQHQTYLAGLRLSQLEKIRHLHETSKESPWVSGGIGAGLGALLGGGIGYHFLKRPLAGAIGGGLGALAGGYIGASGPSHAKQRLHELAAGQPGEFEVGTAPPGTPQAFGDDDEIMVHAKLRRQNKELLRRLLGQ